VDELELISRLREEVPLASADRAEHAFLASVRGRGARPVRRHGLVRPLRPRAEIAAPALRRRRTAAVVIAAAAAAGLVAAGLTLPPGNTSLPGSTSGGSSAAAAGASPAAAQLLAKIAAAAAAQPSPPVRGSQFVYLKTWGGGSVCKALPSAKSVSVRAPTRWDCVPDKPEEVQFWYPVSSLCATGAFLEDGGRLTKFSYKADSENPRQFPCDGNVNYPTYQFMETLPTDPHALLSLIQHEMHRPTAGRQGLYWTFFIIGTLLYNGPPPAVTAALYRAAALIPGVTLVPDATDTVGRHGVAVDFTFQGMRTEWIFSKQTLQYLGSREINVANGAIISEQAITQHGFVDHTGQTPG
jgi:hypothetical protein